MFQCNMAILCKLEPVLLVGVIHPLPFLASLQAALHMCIYVHLFLKILPIFLGSFKVHITVKPCKDYCKECWLNLRPRGRDFVVVAISDQSIEFFIEEISITIRLRARSVIPRYTSPSYPHLLGAYDMYIYTFNFPCKRGVSVQICTT